MLDCVYSICLSQWIPCPRPRHPYIWSSQAELDEPTRSRSFILANAVNSYGLRSWLCTIDTDVPTCFALSREFSQSTAISREPDQAAVLRGSQIMLRFFQDFIGFVVVLDLQKRLEASIAVRNLGFVLFEEYPWTLVFSQVNSGRGSLVDATKQLSRAQRVCDIAEDVIAPEWSPNWSFTNEFW